MTSSSNGKHLGRVGRENLTAGDNEGGRCTHHVSTRSANPCPGKQFQSTGPNGRTADICSAHLDLLDTTSNLSWRGEKNINVGLSPIDLTISSKLFVRRLPCISCLKCTVLELFKCFVWALLPFKKVQRAEMKCLYLKSQIVHIGSSQNYHLSLSLHKLTSLVHNNADSQPPTLEQHLP